MQNKKEEIIDKHAKTINNGKMKYETKEKAKVDNKNCDPKEHQYKKAKREDVEMNIYNHSEMNTNA